MKNRLLPLLFVLGSYSAYSQVGIGKLNPDASAQLEVFATDKGMLIPRVTLTGSTDQTTITNGNKESLLVYNTVAVSDVKIGYHYWSVSDNKWHRLAISSEITGGIDGLAGGPGAPGDVGVTVPADAIAWIDTATGYVYIKDADNKWVKVSGKDGVDGAAGLAGGPGVPGVAGVTPPASTTTWIDTTTGIIYVYDPATQEWVKVNGNDGKNGIDGIQGNPGDAGVVIPTGATILVNEAGVVFIKDPNTGNWIKVSGNNGVDGAAGLAGGPGVPGETGVTVPADTTAWIDTTTGYIYVKDANDNWIRISAKDGVDGAAGLAGGPGIPGIDGVALAPAGVTTWIDTTTGIVYILDPVSGKWVKVSGNNGKDGIIGIKGDPGDPGVTIPAEATILVNDAGVVFIKDPNTGNWIKVSGNNGVDGAAGLAGGPGLPGDPGITVPADTSAWVDTTTGYIYVKDADGNWVKVSAKDGVDGAAGLAGGPGVPGAPGVTIPASATAWIDTETGIVYIYDPATKEWVKVSGNNGKDGIIGIKGDPGDPGVAIPAEATILVNDEGVVFIKDPNTGNWIKVSGNNGVDGAAGLAGGPGLPGDPGITVPAGTTAWIDTTTGYVYVQDPVTKEWVKVSGKDGVDGAAGLAGGPGVPGLDGVTPPAGTTAWIDTKTGIVYIYDPATKEWVKVSGNNGKDGIIGIKGDPGDPGVTIPAEATILVNDEGVVFIKDPNTGNWIKVSGNNGVDGAAGLAGGPGLPGDPGITVPAGTTAWIDTTTGYVYVQDPVTKEWVKVSGKDGVDGATGLAGGPGVPGLDGVTPPAGTTAWIDTKTGIVYIYDPATKEWVKVSGNNGKDGIIGIKGDPGDPGVTIPAEATILVNDEGVVFIKDPNTGNWIKVSGNNGVDGAAGLAGGPGLPGDPGITVPADTTAWVDTTTGYIYIKDADGNWIKVSGKNGVDGAAGLAGGPGAPGEPGVTIPATTTTWIDTTTGNVYVLDPITKEWIKVSGANGKDGKSFTYADFTADELAGLKGADGVTSFVPTVTEGNTIATFTDAAGNPAAIKETITSLKDVVTETTDVRGQVFQKHTLTYTDEAGVESPIDMSTLVKGVETLTSLAYDGSVGELSYKDEEGVTTSFNMVDMVGANQTLTKLVVNSDEGTLDYTDENKATHPLSLADLVREPWYGVDSKKGAILNTENIYTQGWVGIGFDTPSTAANEKLRVNGAITVVNSYYADYVFEDYFKGFSDIKADYKFKTLTEIDAYIKKNKHLPGITPINELMKTKEGYSFNISELSIQLLEKTEELYLHIIEQDKELEAKNNEIEQLKIESKSLKAATDEMNARLEKLEKLISNK